MGYSITVKKQRALFHVQSTNSSWLLRARLGPTYWSMRSDNLPRKTQRHKQKLSQQNGIKDEKTPSYWGRYGIAVCKSDARRGIESFNPYS